MCRVSCFHLVALLATSAPSLAEGREALNLDFFRAFARRDAVLELENVDMACVSGVLSYIHTEVVGEHFIKQKEKSRRLADVVDSGLDEGDIDLEDLDEAGPRSDPSDLSLGGSRTPEAEELPESADFDLETPADFPWSVMLPARPAEVDEADAPESLVDVSEAHAGAGDEEDDDEEDFPWGDEAAHSESEGGVVTGEVSDHADEDGKNHAPEVAGGIGNILLGSSAPSKKSTRRRVRTERRKGIDVVGQFAFQVQNAPLVLNSDEVNFVDFGPGTSFIDGEAQTHGKVYNWDYGDVVGAVERVDIRFPTLKPAYWFSLSGMCPNLKWEYKVDPDTGDPHEMCVAGPNNEGFLMGGLCRDRDTPNGTLGCVYTYEKPKKEDMLSLDELSGITEEDCGGRKCTDWHDFRTKCTNEKYKKQFNYGRRRVLVKSKECVEYDIHPACHASCGSRACKKVKEFQRDIGLPFWRGRCTAEANAWRAEELARKFGIAGAMVDHNLLSAQAQKTIESCLPEQPSSPSDEPGSKSTMCNPRPEYGYMYCTRHWAGICQPCYIPDTVKKLRSTSKRVMCPWAVLRDPDYIGKPPPVCRTQSPRDRCCLYTGTCNITVPETPMFAAAQVPLDVDGFSIMASRGSTEAMAAFLTRYHGVRGGELVDAPGLAKFAYWQWAPYPIPGRSFGRAVALSKVYFRFPTTTTPPPRRHNAPGDYEEDIAPTDAPAEDAQSGAFGAVRVCHAWMFIVGVVMGGFAF